MIPTNERTQTAPRQITFNEIPEALTQLFSELGDIKRLLQQKTNEKHPESSDRWLSIEELTEYIPGNPKRATIYGLVHRREIPHKKMGKRLIFLKSDIDSWIKSKGRKTATETAEAADQFISKGKG